MKKVNIDKSFSAFVILQVLQIIVLYFFKYYAHDFTLNEFSFLKTGNLLNLLLFLFLISTAIILRVKRVESYKRFSKLFIILSIIGLLSIIGGGVLNSINTGIEATVLDTPFYKIYNAVVFNVFQFSQFFIIGLLWELLLDAKKVILLKSAYISLFLGITFFGFAFIYVSLPPNSIFDTNESTQADYGVVLGAAVWKVNQPSPILKSRIEKAFELYDTKKISKIQLTGSNAPGEKSEAEVAFNYLMKFKVNPLDVRIEKNTKSTIEQINFIKSYLIVKENVSKIVVISDEFHLSRVLEQASFYNVNIDVAASGLKLSAETLVYYKAREALGLLNFWFFAVK